MKVFGAGTCRHAYVATTCTKSKLRAICCLMQSYIYILVAATNEILYGKNCRDLGTENCTRSDLLASKINKIFLGEYTPTPPPDTACGCTLEPHHSLLWACLAILQIHSGTFVYLDKVVGCCAHSVCPHRLELESILY